jgi:prefoldin alpha subunit
MEDEGARGEEARRQEVPVAKFIDDVGQYLEGKESVDQALRELQEQYQQFKRVESRLQQQRMRLEQKVPEIERALASVKLLEQRRQANEATIVDYELADNVYARASVDAGECVYLWLGASVMLEYSTEEATSLLERNLENAKQSLERNRSDMDKLRESMTTTEVSMARVFNYGQKQRQSSASGERPS